MRPSLGLILARGLYQIFVESEYAVQKDWAPIMTFENRYDLAREGIYGTKDDVLRDLIKFTAEFKKRR